MTQYRYEVRGLFVEEKKTVHFVYITPPCSNEYTAKMCVIGKLANLGAVIDTVTRVIE